MLERSGRGMVGGSGPRLRRKDGSRRARRDARFGMRMGGRRVSVGSSVELGI
jgi:hypothetical protein